MPPKAAAAAPNATWPRRPGTLLLALCLFSTLASWAGATSAGWGTQQQDSRPRPKKHHAPLKKDHPVTRRPSHHPMTPTPVHMSRPHTIAIPEVTDKLKEFKSVMEKVNNVT